MFRYLPKKFLMNHNEFMFYKKLDEALGSQYKIIPQVHLDELAQPKRSSWRIFSFRHINQKSVDFALCDKKTFAPVIAIELDGDSHLEKAIQERDIEVGRILQEVDMPLVRFSIKENNGSDEIKKRILEKIKR